MVRLYGKAPYRIVLVHGGPGAIGALKDLHKNWRNYRKQRLIGIPIRSEQGQGGISIMESYRVDRTVLSSEDMKAILTGLQSLDSVNGTNRYPSAYGENIP